MAFEELKEEELRAVAFHFGIELPPEDSEELPKTAKARQKRLAAVLTEGDEGLTWEDYETGYLPTKPKTEEEVAAEEEERAANRDTLVRMKGNRRSFTFRDLKFTADHPFATVTKDEAVYLQTQVGGFAYATPQEVNDYYDA